MNRTGTLPSRLRRQRGMALVLVLWATTLMALVAVTLSGIARTDLMVARNTTDLLAARHAADGAIHVVLARALGDIDRAAVAPAARFQVAGIPVAVTVRDEAGKVDLNDAPDPVIRALLRHVVGDDLARADRLADRILDWRDADDDRRLSGAEADDYVRLGLDRLPGNRDFADVAELAGIPGITGPVFRRLAPLVTVVNGTATVDVAAAAGPVLAALPNVERGGLDQLLRLRADAIRLDRDLPTLALPLPPDLVGGEEERAARLGRVLTVHAVTGGGDRTPVVARRALVLVAGTAADAPAGTGSPAPYRVIALGDADHDPSPAGWEETLTAMEGSDG